jgi:hypothetical protein
MCKGLEVKDRTGFAQVGPLGSNTGSPTMHLAPFYYNVA